MKVLQGQSIFDIAIQELGSAEGAMDIALLRGMLLTDDLPVGTELAMPPVVNRSIAEYYRNKGIRPATGLDSVWSFVFDDTFSFVFS